MINLFTVGDYAPDIINNIKEGKIYKAKGGIIFTCFKQASKWKNGNYPNGLVYKLIGFSSKDHYSNPTFTYPNKRIVKNSIKMMYLH